MSNSVEQQAHEEDNKTWRKTMEKKRQDWNWNKTQVWTKNLTQTKRMDAPKAWMALDTIWWILAVGEKGDPWKTPRSRWNATEMKIKARRALDNGGFWWRWRVEVELWYERWLEEMKEKVSHVCSQNNKEWSDLNTNILLEISRVITIA